MSGIEAEAVSGKVSSQVFGELEGTSSILNGLLSFSESVVFADFCTT